jgi:hypothetical protein
MQEAVELIKKAGACPYPITKQVSDQALKTDFF